MSDLQLYNSLPIELLVDILSIVPTRSVVYFACASNAHLQLFNEKNGLWKLLTCTIQHWSQNGTRSNPIEQIIINISF